jgi:hypothetical protein
MERLFRSANTLVVVLAGLTVFLSIISGMPECTFLILLYGYAYFAFRVATTGPFRDLWRHSRNFVLANMVGFGLAAFLLLPFLEFLQHGLDSHRPSITGVIGGLLHAQDYRTLLLTLLPMVTGPPFHYIFTGFSGGVGNLFGYFGVCAVTLGFVALGTVWPKRHDGQSSPERILVCFFLISTIAFILKFYGHWSVNWIGSLPLFNLVLFPKYIQPLLGFAVAMLAGLGASQLFTGRIGLAWILLSPLAILAATGFLASRFRAELLGFGKHDYIFYVNILFAASLLLVLMASMAWCTRQIAPGWARTAARSSVILLLAVELSGNYIYPMYHRWSQPSSASLNPYNGAPYTRFLQARKDYYRVFGRGWYLHPNWASVFSLHDVRYINGMNWKKYFLFIRALLASSDVGLHGDLADRFTGGDYIYAFRSWKEERFLQLSSIRYLVTGDPFLEKSSPLITEALRQNETRIKAEQIPVQRRSFVIGDDGRDVLFTHPPISRLRVVTEIPSTASVLEFSPAFDPAVFGGCGDGVEFLLELRDRSGRIHTLYRRYLDPKRNPAEQRWFNEQIDLSRYRGKTVEILFSTSGGPAGDTGCDWAGWAGLEYSEATVANDKETAPKFRQIYHDRARIFEYANPLPRASVFYSASLATSSEAALARLQDPGLDVWRQVVITTDGMDNAVRSAVKPLGAAAGELAQPAKIIHYDSQRAVIRAALTRPGLVLLTDSNYPGWNAYLDGRWVPLVEANYLFRGVLAPAGTHVVEFRYEPDSYFYGGLISLVTLLGAFAWVLSQTQQFQRLRRHGR